MLDSTCGSHADEAHYWVAIDDGMQPISEMNLREIQRRRPAEWNNLTAFRLGADDVGYGDLLFDEVGKLKLAMIDHGKALTRDLACDISLINSSEDLIDLRAEAGWCFEEDGDISEVLHVAYEMRELNRLEAEVESIRTRLTLTLADEEPDDIDE